ncbi:MAG TPA: ATP-binding protein [Candidatus Udaeobacter sp.]|nr:ATP-binding protein [Candidatus Udaeobacter sp.]
MRKIQKPEKQRRKMEVEWNWRKNFRVWDANRKIFLYPENWIEPKLRLPARFRVSLNDVAVYIRPRCRAKGFRVLLAGKNRTRRLLAVQTLARDLEKDLYRIDLNGVVSDYIGETEKNLDRVFDLAKKNRVVLFFDEADALFSKRADAKGSHDSHATIEIKYVLRRAGKNGGLTILATARRANIDNALMRRFHLVIHIPQRRKLRRKESSTC